MESKYIGLVRPARLPGCHRLRLFDSDGSSTAFQRFCQCWIVLQSQDARRARTSADSCRERANTWTERSMVEPDGPTRADFARRAAWFASRAEAHEARAKHHDLEVLINRFLQ